MHQKNIKDICDFLHAKIVTIGSGVDQNKKSPSFWPIDQKIPILHEKLQFSMKRGFFDQWVKKIFCFDQHLSQW